MATSDTDETGHGQVRRAVRDVVTGVDGISGVSMGVITIDDASIRPSDVIIRAIAWGPGLHGMAVAWHLHLPRHAPTWIPFLRNRRRRRLETGIATGLAKHLDMQRARAARAAGLGIATPLELPAPATAASTPESIVFDHLLMDRAMLLALVGNMVELADGAPVARLTLDRQIAFDTATAYDEATQGPSVLVGDIVRDDGRMVRGFNAIRKLATTLSEVETVDGTQSLLQPTFALGSGATVASFDGSHLIILAQIPETIAAVAVGRPVGDLVETGFGIDARPILAIDAISRSTIVTTTVDAVRVADIPKETVTVADILAMPSVEIRTQK